MIKHILCIFIISFRYVVHMEPYKGRLLEPTPAGHLQGADVVMKLLGLAGLLTKGYHVVCDSFFCSLELARRLYHNVTYITGTLRSNRPMPQVCYNLNNHDVVIKISWAI